MRCLDLTPPGRFPTVVFDPGELWGRLDAPARLNLNTAWWRALCSPDVLRRALPGGWLARLRRTADGLDIAASAGRAAAALEAFRRADTLADPEAHAAAADALAAHLDTLNRAQEEVHLSLDAGPRVRGLNYADSRAVVAFARRASFLSATIRAALTSAAADVDLLLLRATSPEDLLTGLIAVSFFRERTPAVHACLYDHGYENFTLQLHVDRLRETGALAEAVDTIIVSKDERDAVVAALAAALARGERPRGFFRASDLPPAPPGPVRPAMAPPTDVFAPEPVLWTRISGRRCYWSRCAFCVHNEKYELRRPPTRADVAPALDRVEAALAAGYRTFIFSDEALSPALLGELARGILARGLRFRWACRSKLEKAHTGELLDLLVRAGCREILFGLETVSERVQRLMDKHVDGLDASRVRGILADMDAAGLAVHLNLLANFPGDTPEEVEATVAFAADALEGLRGATFILNRFALFPGSPAARNPARYGLVVAPPAGDMPFELDHDVCDALRADRDAIDARLPALAAHLEERLGWASTSPAARALYFGSGHGILMKSFEEACA